MRLCRLIFQRIAFALAALSGRTQMPVSFTQMEFKDMIPQPIADAIARIKAALAAHTDQSAVIDGLRSQLADCEAKDAAMAAQVADLTSQLAEVQAAVAAVVPDPAAAPADGSASGDVAP